MTKPRRMHAHRASGVIAAALLVAGCGAPVPATTWLRLNAEPPAPAALVPGSAAAAASSTAAAVETWQLVGPVRVPAYLDRDTLFVPQGAGGAALRPLGSARWVEPLRDALPRVLHEDLVRALRLRRPALSLWTSPLPPGVQPARQLRVELTAFEIDAGGRAVLLRARWSLAAADGAAPPAVHEAAFETPVTAVEDAGAWATAHRQAIAALAGRVAATMAP